MNGHESAKSDGFSDDYWHVVSWPAHLFHNAPLRQGLVSTVSRMSAENPGMVTVNDLRPKVGDFEQVLEKIRAAEFSDKPPRRGVIYLFNSEAIAQAAAQAWWPGKRTWIVRARVLEKESRIHKGHLGWFEEPKNLWDEAARGYWRGDQNSRPPGHWEYFVDGTIFFPDWEAEPFGPWSFAEIMKAGPDKNAE